MRKVLAVIGSVIILITAYLWFSTFIVGKKSTSFICTNIDFSNNLIKVKGIFSDSASAFKDYKYKIEDNKLYLDIYSVLVSKFYSTSNIDISIEGEFSNIEYVYSNNKLIWSKYEEPNMILYNKTKDKVLAWYLDLEVPSPIYIKDKNKDILKVLDVLEQPENMQLKCATWYDNNSLILAFGSLYGTVEKGRYIYYWDLENEPKLIHTNDKYTNTVSLSMTKAGSIIFKNIYYIDSNFNEYIETEDEFILQREDIITLEGEKSSNVIGYADYSNIDSFSNKLTLTKDSEVINIIPKYVGSTVKINRVIYNVDKLEMGEQVAIYENTAKDFILRIETVLPEVMPSYMVTIENNGETGYFYLAYDGRGASMLHLITKS